MRILILDDMKERHTVLNRRSIGHNTTNVFTYDECIDALQNQDPFDLLLLDHDLSEAAIMCDPNIYNEKTGTDVAKWIVDNKHPDAFRKILVHSMNPVGANNMVSILQHAGFNAERYAL